MKEIEKDVDPRFAAMYKRSSFKICKKANPDPQKEYHAALDTSTKKNDPKDILKSLNMEAKIEYLNRLARGEVSEPDDSSESPSDSSDKSNDDYDYEHADSSSKISFSKHEHSQRSLIGRFYDDCDPTSHEYADEEEAPSTNRLAIQNCDWDNIKAVDLFLIVQSFCRTGVVKKITVYSSDFGKQRMAEEEMHGPRRIWQDEARMDEDEKYDGDEDFEGLRPVIGGKDDKKSGDFIRKSGVIGIVIQGDDEQDSDDANDGEMNDIKLREYELNKLRYYFAIAEMDSVAAAEEVYKELDMVELEHSSMIIDLRFVPDDVSFEGRDIRDSCAELPAVYNPPDFIVNALQQTNISCTWDSGEREREKKLTNFSAWRQLSESDLQQYLGSSDDSDDENEEKKRKAAHMRKILLGDEDNEDDASNTDQFFVSDHCAADVDKTLSFMPNEIDGKEISSEILFEAEANSQTRKKKRNFKKAENISNNTELKMQPNKGISSVVEGSKVMEKEQLDLLFVCDDDESSRREYSMRDIIKHSRKKKSKLNYPADKSLDDFDIDLYDQRFKEMFESGDGKFGIDRTANEFKETPVMKKILEEQRKRRRREIEQTRSKDGDNENDKSHVVNDDVSTLVKRIKKNIHTFD